jgi:hypothetical protein
MADVVLLAAAAAFFRAQASSLAFLVISAPPLLAGLLFGIGAATRKKGREEGRRLR